MKNKYLNPIIKWTKKLNKKSKTENIVNLAWQTQRNFIDKDEPIIFDIGANRGDITHLYLQLFPQATIHAFEPTPVLFNLLYNRNQTDYRVVCNQLAIANFERLSNFNINSSLDTNSLKKVDPVAEEIWGKNLLDLQDTIEVNVTTIDNYCKMNSINHIDIVKLDIQGSDFDALDGASNLLKDQNISLVYVEIIITDTYVGQRKLHEYLELMDGFGYLLFNIYIPKIRQQQIAQADFLFVTPQLLLSFRQSKGIL